jgi:toxin ParE1/3/4
MRPFLLASAARDDMINIGRFTGERWGKQQRNTYFKQLDDAFKLLAQQPGIEKDAVAIKPSYRKFVQGSHIIFIAQVPSQKFS